MVTPINPWADMKYDFTNPNTKFDAGYFFKQINQLRELQKIDTTRKDGLEAYFKIDPNAPRYDSQALKDMPKAMVGYEGQKLFDFAKRNVGGLVGLLNEEQAIQVALESPAFKRKGKSLDNTEEEQKRKAKEDKYNGVVGKIDYMQTVFDRTEKDPQGYAKDALKNIKPDSLSYGFFISNMKIVMEADKRISQNRAVAALRDYGVQSYVGQNMSRGLELEERTEAQNKAEQVVANMLQAFEIEADPAKKIKLHEEFTKARSKYSEDFRDNLAAQESMSEMIVSLQKGAYQSMAQKKAAEEAKKKAAEAAAKK